MLQFLYVHLTKQPQDSLREAHILVLYTPEEPTIVIPSWAELK